MDAGDQIEMILWLSSILAGCERDNTELGSIGILSVKRNDQPLVDQYSMTLCMFAVIFAASPFYGCLSGLEVFNGINFQ